MAWQSARSAESVGEWAFYIALTDLALAFHSLVLVKCACRPQPVGWLL